MNTINMTASELYELAELLSRFSEDLTDREEDLQNPIARIMEMCKVEIDEMIALREEGIREDVEDLGGELE